MKKNRIVSYILAFILAFQPVSAIGEYVTNETSEKSVSTADNEGSGASQAATWHSSGQGSAAPIGTTESGENNVSGAGSENTSETINPSNETGTANDFEFVEEKYGVDSIIANAEAEQDYRASVNYVENKLIFSVKDVRSENSTPIRLNDKSEICKTYNLKNVEFVLESALPGYDDSNEKGYECFYEATISTEENEDVWTYVDLFKHEESVLSAEPDIIWAKTDQGDMQVMSEAQGEEISAAGWCFDELGITGIWNSLTNSNRPGEGVVVAVIDTGVDYTHKDIKDNMWINDDEIPDNGIDDDGDGYVDNIYGINLIENSGDPMDDMGTMWPV